MWGEIWERTQGNLPPGSTSYKNCLLYTNLYYSIESRTYNSRYHNSLRTAKEIQVLDAYEIPPIRTAFVEALGPQSKAKGRHGVL